MPKVFPMAFFVCLATIQAVLFDLDDTLIRGPHIWAWRIAMWFLGLVPPEGWEQKQVGLKNEKAVDLLFSSETQEKRNQLVEIKSELAVALAKYSRPMLGVRDAVEGLVARRCAFGIATSSPRPFVLGACAGGALAAFDDRCWVTPDVDYKESKPDPGCLIALRSKLGLAASDHVVYVGDSNIDKLTAENATARGYPTTFVRFVPDDTLIDGELCITDHRQILELLDQFGEGVRGLHGG